MAASARVGRGDADRDFDIGELSGRLSALESQVERFPELLAAMKQEIVAVSLENRRLAAEQHGEQKRDFDRQLKTLWDAHDALRGEVAALKEADAKRVGAASVKRRLWQRLDAYALALLVAAGSIVAGAIGLAPVLVQHFGGK